MASTVRLGNDASGNAVHVPLRNLLPTVHPNDLVVGGWDICSDNLGVAMTKAAVLVRTFLVFCGTHLTTSVLFSLVEECVVQ